MRTQRKPWGAVTWGGQESVVLRHQFNYSAPSSLEWTKWQFPLPNLESWLCTPGVCSISSLESHSIACPEQLSEEALTLWAWNIPEEAFPGEHLGRQTPCWLFSCIWHWLLLVWFVKGAERKHIWATIPASTQWSVGLMWYGWHPTVGLQIVGLDEAGLTLAG